MKINVWNEQIQLENPELVIGRIAKSVILEIWNGRQKDSVIRREYPYTRITQTEDGLKACTEIDDEWAGKTEVTDIYRTEEGSVVLSRQVRILRESGYPGMRLRTEISLLPEKKNAFEDLRYFARRQSMTRMIWMRMDMRIIFIPKKLYSGMTVLIIRCLPVIQRKQRRLSA